MDGLIIFQIQETGPLAQPFPGGDPKPAAVVDGILYAILDGVVPKGAKTLEADPALDGESFFQAGGSLYLRTTRALLWPAPQARVSGPGGLAVYELPLVPSVMLHDADEVRTVNLRGLEAERPLSGEIRP